MGLYIFPTHNPDIHTFYLFFFVLSGSHNLLQQLRELCIVVNQHFRYLTVIFKTLIVLFSGLFPAFCNFLNFSFHLVMSAFLIFWPGF